MARRSQRVRGLALAGVAVLALIFGVRAGIDSGGDSDAAGDDVAAGPQLPGGGREIFPRSRVVAFYGAPQDPALGALGVGGPVQAARALEAQAREYDGAKRPVLPAFELIAVIAAADPGPSGHYNLRVPRSTIRKYSRVTKREGALLILDIQPGTAAFMTEIEALAPFLKLPNVSLALDPEWHLDEGEIPGQTLGSVTAAEVNEVGAYLSEIVRENDLPQKLLVVHQFTQTMIEDREALEEHPGVALTLNADGFGERPNKVSKYRGLRPALSGLDDVAFSGFKLFYEEDIGLMTPNDVLDLRPAPDLVVYE